MRSSHRPSASASALTRVLAAVFVVLVAIAFSGCGGNDEPAAGEDSAATTLGGDGGLEGLTRDPPLQVGEQTLPEVTPGAEGEFAFRAEPGDLLVVYFGYTSCPDVCPTSMSDLGAALDELGEDAERVGTAMVTVDPERDTPEVLGGYVGFFVEGAHALRTEDPARLEQVEDAFLATSEIIPADGSDGYDVEHSASMYVVDDRGEVLVEWPFGTEPAAMAADLRRLLEQ